MTAPVRQFTHFFVCVFVLAISWLLPLSTATATTLPAGISKVTSVEGVTEYALSNGLHVLFAPDDSRPSTTVNMTYLVGSRHENYGQTGMAHLLEHMLFRGTPTLRNALSEFSRRGLSANGSTTADRTNYYASFAANPETLAWYLRWQADVMVNALILREDLDAEMTVVRNEMERGENSPFQMLMQKMTSAAYQWHSYGKSTIGARSDVENVDIEQLRAFYHEYYQPDNAVLIVTGKFNPDTTLNVIADAFGALPKPARKLPPEYTVEPVQDGERAVVLRRQGGTPLAAAMYHAPAAADPQFTALDMATAVLSDSPSGPLYKNLVQPGLAGSVFGFSAERRQPGYVFFGSELTGKQDAEKALLQLTHTLESPPDDVFTEQSVQRVRSRWSTAWTQVYSDPAHLASALSECVAEGDWRLFFLQRDRAEHVTAEQARQAAQHYLVAANRTSGVYIPTTTPQRAPEQKPVNPHALLEGYTGKGERQKVASFVATPESIDQATQRSPLTLPNGTVKLALLPKPTAGGQVYATLVLQFGDAQSLKGFREVSEATAALLDHGTKTLSRQAIEDRFTELHANVGFSGSAGNVVVRISTQGNDLPEVLDLVLQVLKDASFPASELEQYQAQAATALRNAMAEPDALASRALARHNNPWPADDPRYTPTFQQALSDVQALTPEQLQAFHDRFYGAGSISFSAVGTFDADTIRNHLSSGLNGWKKAPAYTRLSDPYHQVPAKTFTINTPDKANAFYLASMPLHIQDTDPDFAALYVANYLLGGSQSSRLWNRVRETDGLSYTVGSSLDISSYEPSGSWSVYAIHAPENSQRLLHAIDEEIARALKDGFSEKEVQEAITAILNFRKLARARDEVLSSSWINYLQLGRTFTWSAKLDAELQALSADKVNQALRTWFKPEDLSVALAADQARQTKN